MINTYIPYLKSNEKKKLLNCIKANFVSTVGPNVEKFEKLFCNKFKFKNAIALNSGTSALHLALLISKIKIDDLIITPSYTFAATANAILYTGAKPWFFDCDKGLILDLDKLENFIQKKTFIRRKTLIDKSTRKKIKAIIVVQSFGKKIDFQKFEEFAKKYFLKIIFDSASCHNQNIFQFKKNSDSIFCFSFNGNKTLTTGAGGILATNSDYLTEKARLFSTVGKKSGNYDHQLIGYNYKMTNIQAGIGISQLNNLNFILRKKRKIFDYYHSKLKDNKNFIMVHNRNYINWVFYLILKNNNKFNFLKNEFNKNDIQLDHFWKPLHLQKPYSKFKKEKLNTTQDLWKKVVILPSHPGINRLDQDKIIKALHRSL